MYNSRQSDASDNRRGLRATALGMLTLLALASCGEKRGGYVANVGDGETTPTMTTYDVETFISDSGYTRYHISTPLWLMYEDAAEPYWRFPDRLNMQQYDMDMQPAASMDCDSAVYYSRMRLWRLDGHVVMVNTMRDSFLSQQLYWDQARRKVYTDSFIHIVRSDRTIEGYGFESNENMTVYTVNKPTAIIPVEHRPGEQGATEQGDSLTGDSAAVGQIVPRRRQAMRRTAPSRTESDAVQPPVGPDKTTKLAPNSEKVKITRNNI